MSNTPDPTISGKYHWKEKKIFVEPSDLLFLLIESKIEISTFTITVWKIVILLSLEKYFVRFTFYSPKIYFDQVLSINKELLLHG